MSTPAKVFIRCPVCSERVPQLRKRESEIDLAEYQAWLADREAEQARACQYNRTLNHYGARIVEAGT